jgi:hypothetical protein
VLHLVQFDDNVLYGSRQDEQTPGVTLQEHPLGHAGFCTHDPFSASIKSELQAAQLVERFLLGSVQAEHTDGLTP